LTTLGGPDSAATSRRLRRHLAAKVFELGADADDRDGPVIQVTADGSDYR
jgi:hypothetical protein